MTSSSIENVKKNHPDYFIITGDLVYNGSKTSHLELQTKLKELHDLGIEPLVIPGNHDIYIGKPRDYSSTEYKIIDSIDEDDFRTIYANAGYEGAISYAPNTLSYIYETKNKEWFLMLDTSLSRYNSEYGMDFTSGDFEDYDWLEEQLKIGQSRGVKMISFSHHSLISHNAAFDSKYKIASSDKLCQLYAKYDVHASFSGHLHIQNKVSKDGITDVCQSSLITYGNRYGEVKITKKTLKYESKAIDFTLSDNTSFRDYSFDIFKRMQTVKNASKSEYYSLVNTYYFDGSLYLHPELKSNKEYRENIDSQSVYFKGIVDNFDTNNHKFAITL